jgi:putative ABC transport system permease protein
MATLWQDVRYGLRMLARNPGFAVVVVLILAVGIGANTAVFSVVNAVMLRPLPYKDSHRIMNLWEQTKQGERLTSHRNFLYWRAQNQVFERLAAYGVRFAYVTGIDRPRKVTAWAVSPGLFPLLGVSPLLGRGLLAEEEQAGNERVVVLSHAFWQDHFGASPDALGKTIDLTTEHQDNEGRTTFQRQSYSIVGIMPAGFEFPFGRPAPFWVPLVLEAGTRDRGKSPALLALARPRKGVTLEQARAAMGVIAGRLQEMDPQANAQRTIGVDWLLNRILRGRHKPLLLLLGAAGFVLLIACGNVANLFLARATARLREMAMRVALGASRGRVLRQILTESLILSVGAGLLGLLLVFLTVRGLARLCPAEIPRLKDASVDLPVLLFTLGVSVLTGLVFGVLPAWRASDIRVSQTLKEGWARSGTGRGWRRLHGSLVVSQLGLSLILLAGAALLIRSLVALQRVDLGFQPENILAVFIDLPEAKYPESHHRRAFLEPLLERVRALPHIRSAGLTTGDFDLGSTSMTMDISIPGRPPSGPEEGLSAKWASVSPGYFEAMGVKFVRGRTFREQDEGSVVIDETLARKYFADVDPVGQTITISIDEAGRTIVGVVSTLKDFQTLDPADGAVYVPPLSFVPGRVVLVVRTDGDPADSAGAVRAQADALSEEEVIVKIETAEATLSRMLAPRRFVMILLGLFAGIALILAAVGIYGLLQYSTAQQTHDIGIHMALGARRIDIVKAILTHGFKLTLIGVAVGLAGAAGLTRLLASFLYGVTPTDPLTLAGVSFLLAGITLLASYLPARRAAKVDPMVALRYE